MCTRVLSSTEMVQPKTPYGLFNLLQSSPAPKIHTLRTEETVVCFPLDAIQKVDRWGLCYAHKVHRQDYFSSYRAVCMATIKDWVLSQMLSKSIGSTRPISASESYLDESLDEESENQGLTHTNTNLITQPVSAEPCSSGDNQMAPHPISLGMESSSGSNLSSEETDLDPLIVVEAQQINFLRTLQRLGLSRDNLLVAKVLYRIQLATLIRAGESDLKRANFKLDRARATAAEQEAIDMPKLNFSLKILVLGRTGVGKSSTINSIFGESKVITDAFQPATNQVQEIVGHVNGIRISFVDTPGLLPSSTNSVSKNRKILHSVKRFVRKSPPDVVLYFERLDLIDMGYCDFSLLKLITDILGPAMWFNTNIVMTHASAALPEGPNGYPVSYDSYVSHCTNVVQHQIHQAILDTKLENPVILVENHPYCMKDNSGRKILPNGQLWTSQFLLLCICTKILGDVSTILEYGDKIQFGRLSNVRHPSLPHLLSSFLKHSVHLNHGGADGETDEFLFSDMEEEDEYEQLPPIRILTRAQVQKLTSSEKKDYLDELDYRETLYLKNLLKQEYIRRKDKDNFDMSVPPSFDSSPPVHRFRCLVTGDQLVARPVLDPHGWDHDVGFDGINLEITREVTKNTIMHVAGQMSKDKQDFNIQSETTAAFLFPRGPAYSIGLDVQSAGKELICSFRGNTKLKSFKHNVTDCGVLVTYHGNRYIFGSKIEDSISVWRRLKLKMNAGHVTGAGLVAYGGSLEATVRGKDYPVRDEKVSLSMTILSFNKEPVLGGNLLCDFRLSRSTSMSVNASVNSQKMGQLRLKMNSSEHMEIALVAAISIFRCLFRRKSKNNLGNRETLETG
ncbi:Avirulence induced protein [Dorcoceras hygrometricum]|uniref:Avirulence induced protein n=1 Tax=Dorcoceras hygrometricum TaxID=472368 RepID=A0A2Z7BDQ3_9LAMI|nr:Avirulence induced protein [Dorcoceras hygrometricum]